VPSAVCDPSVSKVVLVTTRRTNTRESKAPKLTELQRKNAYAARAKPDRTKTAEIKRPPSSVTRSLKRSRIGLEGKKPVEAARTRVNSANAIASNPTTIRNDANSKV